MPPQPNYDFELLTNNCIGAASFALLYYDYLLTLNLEVSRYWTSRRVTWASALFFANRYLSLFGEVPVMFQYFWLSSDLQVCVRTRRFDALCEIAKHLLFPRCSALSSFHQYLAVAIQLIVGVISIMRTYALYACSKLILGLLCISGVAVIVHGVWSVLSQEGSGYTQESLKGNACLFLVTEQAAKSLAAAWTGMLCFDILVFIMTLYKSVINKYRGNAPIVYVMFRDGTIYFGVMMCFCISILLSFHYAKDNLKGVTTILTNVISSVMASRLMLNIRDPRLLSGHGTPSALATITMNPVFTTIIDSTCTYELCTRNQTETGKTDHLESPSLSEDTKKKGA